MLHKRTCEVIENIHVDLVVTKYLNIYISVHQLLFFLTTSSVRCNLLQCSYLTNLAIVAIKIIHLC